MKLRDEFTRVNVAPVDSVGGAKPEPEERPAERVLVPEAATVSGTIDGYLGKLDQTTIVVETTVADVAQHEKEQCKYCRHFNRAKWNQNIAAWKVEGNTAGFDLLNRCKGSAMDKYPEATAAEVDAIIGSMGVCDAYTNLKNGAEQVFHPEAHCPSIDPETQTPWPTMFEYRNEEAKRAAAQKYDNVFATVTKGTK